MTDFRALLQALTAAGVAFIVVRGAAATAHGSTRLTLDLDIVYRRTRENMDRLVAALGPHAPYLRGGPPGLPFLWDRATLERGLNIGKQLSLPGTQQQPNAAATVVGVVGDLKYSKLDANPEPEVYIPNQQSPIPFLPGTLMVQTSSDAAPIASTIRNLVASIDRTQPVHEVKTLDQALADSIAPRRLNLFLLATFAASALLLALIGIYGVIAYAVAQRTHEIGVRMALGARRAQVVRLVVREGVSLAGVGIIVGLAAALGLTRLTSSLLYDVKPNDPSTYAAVAVALVTTALAACWKPALRAARVDPARALREE